MKNMKGNKKKMKNNEISIGDKVKVTKRDGKGVITIKAKVKEIRKSNGDKLLTDGRTDDFWARKVTKDEIA